MYECELTRLLNKCRLFHGVPVHTSGVAIVFVLTDLARDGQNLRVGHRRACVRQNKRFRARNNIFLYYYTIYTTLVVFAFRGGVQPNCEMACHHTRAKDAVLIDAFKPMQPRDFHTQFERALDTQYVNRENDVAEGEVQYPFNLGIS